MKKYIKPTSQPIDIETGNFMMDGASIRIYNGIADDIITDGSEILAPRKSPLWDTDEEEEWGL